MHKERFSRQIVEDAAKASFSISEVGRALGVTLKSGAMWRCVRRLLDGYDIDTSHFKGLAHAKGKAGNRRREAVDVLVVRASETRECTRRLRRAMLDSGVPHRCAQCGVSDQWHGRTLVLHIDHVDGNWQDNRLSNLRFLCPNCHSQTSTHSRAKITGVITLVDCATCGKRLRRKRTAAENFCVSCRDAEFRQGAVRARRVKGVWPVADELATLIWQKPATEVAKLIGVSSVAVKKRCKQLGITTPCRGYWAKQRFSRTSGVMANAQR